MPGERAVNYAPVTTNLDGCAKLLNVSRRTVGRYVKRRSNPLPVAKLSPGNRGTLVFVVEDILVWLRSLQRRPPVRRLRATEKKARTSRPSQRR